jgi:hypothetical protein
LLRLASPRAWRCRRVATRASSRRTTIRGVMALLWWLALVLLIAVPVALVVWFLRRPVDRTVVEPVSEYEKGDSEDVTRDVMLRSGEDAVEDEIEVMSHVDGVRRPRGTI